VIVGGRENERGRGRTEEPCMAGGGGIPRGEQAPRRPSRCHEVPAENCWLKRGGGEMCGKTHKREGWGHNHSGPQKVKKKMGGGKHKTSRSENGRGRGLSVVGHEREK